MSDDFDIRRLLPGDRKDDFCAGPGYEELDRYLRERAGQNDRRKQTVTHVAIVGDRVVGYATTVPGAIEPMRLDGMVKHLSRYPAPVLVLARFATDAAFRGGKQRVGERLLRVAVLDRALQLAEHYGCVGVFVHAKPAPAEAVKTPATFYTKYGFVALPASPHEAERGLAPMFLPLDIVRAARAAT